MYYYTKMKIVVSSNDSIFPQDEWYPFVLDLSNSYLIQYYRIDYIFKELSAMNKSSDFPAIMESKY